MLIRSYQQIHTEHTNAKLLHTCNEIGRRNYWIGKSDSPHNMVEEYLQQWYGAFLTGDYEGIEYWVYKSVKNNPMSFHFDKDEMDPQIEHPKWCACVSLTNDKSATCISNMTYGSIKPEECVYSYGEVGKTVLWDGNVAWGDMEGDGEVKLYINVWTQRKPRGLIRSKEIDYYRQAYMLGMYKKNNIIPYEGEHVYHTHFCSDMFDQFILKEPASREVGSTYRVTDAVLS